MHKVLRRKEKMFNEIVVLEETIKSMREARGGKS